MLEARGSSPGVMYMKTAGATGEDFLQHLQILGSRVIIGGIVAGVPVGIEDTLMMSKI